jgi:hypothetical protein
MLNFYLARGSASPEENSEDMTVALPKATKNAKVKKSLVKPFFEENCL